MELFDSPGFLINQLAHSMSLEFDKRLNRYGVTISQWSVLAVLWKADGLTQMDIGKTLGIQGPTVTGLLNRMTKAGLVDRRPDDHDKRMQRIFLTEKARSIKFHLWNEAEGVNQKALTGLSTEESEMFIRFLRKTQKNFL